MEHEPKGVTLEDLHGEVYEWEAYQDALDEQECSNKCWFSWMEYHKFGCPLYSEIDAKAEARDESNLNIALGK